jgi:hypothetical protein
MPSSSCTVDRAVEKKSHLEQVKHRRSQADGEAEGLISLPDPPDNLWTASSRRSRPGVDGQNHAEFALYNED